MFSRNKTVLASLPVLLLIWSCPPSPLSDVVGQNIVAMVSVTSDSMHEPSYVDLDLVNRDFDSCTMVGLSNFTGDQGDVFEVRTLTVWRGNLNFPSFG